jgi:RNA polymerase sigma-70 factor (ECF subfamily)
VTRARDAERGEDEALMQAVAAGDAQALAALYDRHAAVMLGVALRLLKSRQDAEDLVHDVFVQAWQRAADYDADRGSVRSWLLVRVRSRGIDRVRSLDAARRHGLVPADAEAPPPPPEASAAAPWDAPDRERARLALADLPEAQRRLIELAYFEGLTCSEMAARCEIPIGTVKSRVAAGLARLRQSLLGKERAA